MEIEVKLQIKHAQQHEIQLQQQKVANVLLENKVLWQQEQVSSLVF